MKELQVGQKLLWRPTKPYHGGTKANAYGQYLMGYARCLEESGMGRKWLKAEVTGVFSPTSYLIRIYTNNHTYITSHIQGDTSTEVKIQDISDKLKQKLKRHFNITV